jgi:hypothetical protein
MPQQQDCDSKRIQHVRVYAPKLSTGGKRNLRLYHLVFGACLLLQTALVLTTMGEPYRQFLIKADREGFQGMFHFGFSSYLPKTQRVSTFSIQYLSRIFHL